MRNKLLAILIVVGTILAAARVSPITRLQLDSPTRASSRADEDSLQNQPSPYVPMMIKIADDAVADSLADLGVIVYNRRADILLSSVPREMLDSVLSFRGIYAQSTCGVNTYLDIARADEHIDEILAGTSVGSPYTGSGVVVGISDIGFDAGHIAFRHNLKAVHDFKAAEGVHLSATTPAELSAWTTDDRDNFHATHVANILAGSWMPGLYHGVAPGADLVVTTSDLNDVGILAGVEEVIAYAKSAGKPAVVNLSLGTTLGPHDGTDLQCQYLSACAEDAMICLSAGNDGAKKYVMAAQMIDSENPLSRFIVKDRNTGSALNCTGYVDMWSDSEAPMDVRIDIYDCDLQKIVYEGLWLSEVTAMLEDSVMVVSPETDLQFGRAFDGEIKLYGELNPLNNRFNVAIYFNVACDILSDRGKWSKYHPAVSVRSLTGDMRFNAFAEASRILVEALPNSDIPLYVSPNGSISDLCTAPGVVAVGMYCTRDSAPLWPSGTLTWNDIDVGYVSRYSSYSSGDWGLPALPHVCAPGNTLVSAFSRYFVEANESYPLADITDIDGIGYPWGASGGTSMSSPFTAGIFALWMEANPYLSHDELLQIAIDTATRPADGSFSAAYGHGYIDALTGLERIMAGIECLASDAEPRIRVTSDRHVVVTMPGGKQPAHSIYSIDGTMQPVSASLPRGVYIVDIPGHKPSKIIVK